MLEKAKSILSIIRDVVLLCVFCFVLVAPQTMARMLIARGFGTIHTPLGDVDLKSIGSNTSEAEFAIADAAAVATDPSTRDRLQQALKNLTAVNDTVKAQLSTAGSETAFRTAAVPAAGFTAPATEQYGWVFAGKIDEAKSGWVAGARKAIEGNYPPGPSVTVSENSYIHAESSGGHAAAPVVGAIAAGRMLQVAGIDLARALGGGWFVWMKTPLTAP
jgi:hypothetical protein